MDRLKYAIQEKDQNHRINYAVYLLVMVLLFIAPHIKGEINAALNEYTKEDKY